MYLCVTKLRYKEEQINNNNNIQNVLLNLTTSNIFNELNEMSWVEIVSKISDNRLVLST